MANTVKIPRSWMVMGLCLPLAVLLGYFLAEPLEASSLGVVVLVLAVLSVPLMMKWHHPLLVLSWNAVVVPVFLPGHLNLCVIIALISFFFAVINRSVTPELRFIQISSVNKALLFLAAVVVVTALMTGGLGFRVLGSAHYGGKRYVTILSAVAGYYALTSRRIPLNRTGLYIGLFFLSGMTALLGNAAYWGGNFSFLRAFFPATVTDSFAGLVAFDPSIHRILGLPALAMALYGFLLARYGLRGILDMTKPWRLLLFMVATVVCLAGGYRSALILFGLTVVIQFFLEGLHRTRALLVCAGLAILAAVIVFPQANKLPLAVQRTLSFLPVRVDPVVANDASGSTQWRVDMWKAVWPEVPKYLFKGKGYVLDPDELFEESLNAYRGFGDPSAGSRVAGDYHNGPLSILIPFGIYGLAGFLWFLAASMRTLYRYARYGNPALRLANLSLLAAFTAKTVAFFFVFGGFYGDLFGFVGLIGFGVSLNGPLPEPQEAGEAEASPEMCPEAYETQSRR